MNPPISIINITFLQCPGKIYCILPHDLGIVTGHLQEDIA